MTGNHTLGEDIMIYENNLDSINLKEDHELVAPNNFN